MQILFLLICMMALSSPAAPFASSGPTRIHTGKQWVEKYRPKTLEDVSSQQEAVSVLKKAILNGNVRLILYGYSEFVGLFLNGDNIISTVIIVVGSFHICSFTGRLAPERRQPFWHWPETYLGT